MRRVVRITGIVLAVLLVLGFATAGAVSVLSERKMNRLVDVAVASVDFNSVDASLARGQYVYETRGCGECHGADGAGRVVVDDASSGLYIRAPNITQDKGSVAANYTDADWVRMLRHGVKPSKRPLFVMPSQDYAQMADSDVASLALYVRSLPPATGDGAVFKMPLMLKALYATGVLSDAAEKIDHSLPAPTSAPTASHEVGAYAANMCIGCHGPGLSGGEIPGSPPSWPLAANLTPAPDGAMVRYPTAASFQSMLRTGRRPDGSTVDKVMPFTSLSKMSDAEIAALFDYLKSLAPRPTGQR